MLAIIIAFTACKTKSAEETVSTSTEQSDQLYACPMHPEITGNKGDKCSKCGMELTEPVAAGTTEAATSQVNNEQQEEHEVDKPGAGPNKGIIEEAGEKNHIEMVLDGKNVNFYLLDDMTNPVDMKGLKGTAIFQYKDGKVKTIDLMEMNGTLSAMDANTSTFTVIPTFKVNGQSISSKFKSEGSIGMKDGDAKK